MRDDAVVVYRTLSSEVGKSVIFELAFGTETEKTEFKIRIGDAIMVWDVVSLLIIVQVHKKAQEKVKVKGWL